MSKRPKPRPKPVSSGTRGVEVLTHLWMLSVVTAFACEIVAALASLVLRYFAPEAAMLNLFVGFMLFAALVVGIISLVLLPLVLWKRSVTPPRGVIVFALVAGSAPLAIVLFRAMQ